MVSERADRQVHGILKVCFYSIPAKLRPSLQNTIQVFLSQQKHNVSSTAKKINNISNFRRENAITKIPKKFNIFFKSKRDLDVFFCIFLYFFFASKASW